MESVCRAHAHLNVRPAPAFTDRRLRQSDPCREDLVMPPDLFVILDSFRALQILRKEAHDRYGHVRP